MSTAATGSSFLGDLEKKLFDAGHSAVSGFETLLTAIKNNHGISQSAVEQLIHDGEALIQTSRDTINKVVADAKAGLSEAKGEVQDGVQAVEQPPANTAPPVPQTVPSQPVDTGANNQAGPAPSQSEDPKPVTGS